MQVKQCLLVAGWQRSGVRNQGMCEWAGLQWGAVVSSRELSPGGSEASGSSSLTILSKLGWYRSYCGRRSTGKGRREGSRFGELGGKEGQATLGGRATTRLGGDLRSRHIWRVLANTCTYL